MQTLSSLGFVRLAVISPELRVADVRFNTDRIRDAIIAAATEKCGFLLFPELSLTAYTCGDLFFQPLLLEQARIALQELAAFTASDRTTIVVGAPIEQGGRLFNCAIFIACGRILGIVPKTYLPNTQEFYEERWFSSAFERTADSIDWQGERIPFGTDLLFRAAEFPDCLVGVEICEDAWTASPPSGRMAVQGATLLLNLSASPELLGKAEYRRALVQAQSARCLAAYAYASAGPGESSTDLVFSGHSLIAENGAILAETERFQHQSRMAIADVDIERLRNERLKNNSFAAARETGSLPRDFFLPGRRRRRQTFPADFSHSFCPHWRNGTSAALPGNLRLANDRPRHPAAAYRGQERRHRSFRRPRFHPGAAGNGARLRCPGTRPRGDCRADHARFRHHRAHPHQCRRSRPPSGGESACHPDRRGGARPFPRYRPRRKDCTISPTRMPRRGNAPRS